MDPIWSFIGGVAVGFLFFGFGFCACLMFVNWCFERSAYQGIIKVHLLQIQNTDRKAKGYRPFIMKTEHGEQRILFPLDSQGFLATLFRLCRVRSITVTEDGKMTEG